MTDVYVQFNLNMQCIKMYEKTRWHSTTTHHASVPTMKRYSITDTAAVLAGGEKRLQPTLLSLTQQLQEPVLH